MRRSPSPTVATSTLAARNKAKVKAGVDMIKARVASTQALVTSLVVNIQAQVNILVPLAVSIPVLLVANTLDPAR